MLHAQAYESTGSSVWSQSSAHYCCTGFGLGCVPLEQPPLEVSL